MRSVKSQPKYLLFGLEDWHEIGMKISREREPVGLKNIDRKGKKNRWRNEFYMRMGTGILR